MKHPSASPEEVPGPASSAERLAQRALFEVALDETCDTLRQLRIPESDCADLAQEVLVAAYFRRADYKPERGSLAAWFHGFLINMVRNYRRKRRRRQRLLDDFLPEGPALVPSPDEGSPVTEEHRRIVWEELLPRIPLDQGAVVAARDREGLPMQVVAAREGLPLSTAYDRYHRGRAALERAYASWRSPKKGRGLLLVPFGLKWLLDAGRSIAEALADMAAAAWERVRKARPWEAMRALLRRPALKWIGGGVIGAVLHAALAGQDPAPPLIVALPLPVLVASVASAAPGAAEAALPSAVLPPVASAPISPRPARAPAAMAGAAPVAGNHFTEENRLFYVARRAFDRGDFGEALATLQVHARDFPRGDFTAEREQLWVKVLVKAGQVEEARARIDRLRGSAQGRVLAERLEPFVPKGVSSAAPAR